MTQTITIDPVTRLEGHGKITIHLDSKGHVEDAHFHVTQVRGFEKFSEGRPFYEMPSLMARICGICPVSHLIASAKACEAIMSVRIPPTAAQLRRMLNLAQMVQSGERSGKLGKSLNDIAFACDRDVSEATDKLIGAMEPLLTIIMGAVLAWVVLAVLGPIYGSLGKIAGGM